MIYTLYRDKAWAEQFWPRCLEGVDPTEAYGPEVDLKCHPGDLYWAVVEDQVREYLGDVADWGDVAGGISMGLLDEPVEIGMAWANRYENQHMWTYGFALYPEYRGRAKTSDFNVANEILHHLFEKEGAATALTMVYSTNPRALRYNGLQGDQFAPTRPYRRLVGCVKDAGGPGVDLWTFQSVRSLWQESVVL